MKIICATLLVIAVAALAIPAAAADDIGIVTAVNGTASLLRGSVPPQPVKFKDKVQWRDVIETAKSASARVLLLGKTSLAVRELSRVELREEAVAGGRAQTMVVLSGKVRAIVERSFMDKGEQVEVRSPNAVAAVRGTDFIVEVIPPPAHAQGFGMLAAQDGGPIVAQGPADVTTLVYTIAGVVDVTSGATERITAFQGARVVGGGIPERFAFTLVDLPNITKGLTVPPPVPTKFPQASTATVVRVERTALEQPLRGGAGTVEKPIAGRLVVPGDATGQQAGGDPGAQARTFGVGNAANGVVNVPTNRASKSTDIDAPVDGLRTRVKEANQERLPDSVKTQIRRKLKN